MKRVIIYIRQHSNRTTEAILRQALEHHGDVVVATYSDNGRHAGRGKYTGWRTLASKLDGVDQVVVGGAGDLPGQTVNDLFKILGTFRDRGVGLRLHREDIDTDGGAPAVLDLITAYRAAKLSEAIKIGQSKAVAAGKKIGRPEVPPVIQGRIRAALTEGGGIRPTARQFKVSPAYVINVRRMMVGTDMAAAA